jgi:hypothetical protein
MVESKGSGSKHHVRTLGDDRRPLTSGDVIAFLRCYEKKLSWDPPKPLLATLDAWSSSIVMVVKD